MAVANHLKPRQNAAVEQLHKREIVSSWCSRTLSLGSRCYVLRQVALDVVESLDGLTFARTKEWGYVTSCPTNLGKLFPN